MLFCFFVFFTVACMVTTAFHSYWVCVKPAALIGLKNDTRAPIKHIGKQKKRANFQS